MVTIFYDKHKGGREREAPASQMRLSDHLDRVRLESRDKDTLRRLGIKTVEQFLSMDVSRILGLNGCGHATYERMKSVQKRLRDKFSKVITGSTKMEFPKGGRVSFNKLVSLAVLERLPLFSSSIISKPAATVLHKSYYEQTPLVELDFPRRAQQAFSKLGINTLRALLLTPAGVMLEQKDFGETTLEKIQDIVKSFLLHTAAPGDSRIWDSSSFEVLVRSFVHHVFKPYRAAEILLSRFALNRNNIPTYEEIGKEYGITRARVGQIVQKGQRVFSSQAILKFLAPLWTEVQKVIDENGGLVEVSTLAQKLNHRFGWKSRPRIHALANVLLLNRELHVYGNAELITYADFLNRTMEVDSVCRKDFPCVTCGQGSINLGRIFKSGPEEMDITKAGSRTAAICRKYCPRGIKPPRRFPQVLIVHFALRTDEVVAQDNRVYTKRCWLLRWSESLKEVITAVLETAGHPMHYRELAKYIRRENMKYKNVSAQSVHGYLTHHNHFQLVGRGTYGMESWKIRPYKSRSKAIIELLEKHGKPMPASQIISRLVRTGQFKPQNIQSALCQHPRFVEVGKDLYDLRERTKPGKRQK